MISSSFGHDAPFLVLPAPVCKSAQRARLTPERAFSNFDTVSTVSISLTPSEHRSLVTAVKSLRFENLKSLIALSRSSVNARHVFTLDELVAEGACLDSIIAKLSNFV